MYDTSKAIQYHIQIETPEDIKKKQIQKWKIHPNSVKLDMSLYLLDA